MLQKNINWNDFPTYQKRGTCIVYVDYQNPKSLTDGDKVKGWIIDKDIPIFKGEGRNYIEKLVMVGE